MEGCDTAEDQAAGDGVIEFGAGSVCTARCCRIEASGACSTTMPTPSHHNPAEPAPEPNWQPISMLPTLAEHVSGMLDAAAEQARLIAEAPAGKLDTATLDRCAHAFTEGDGEHQAAHWLYEQQCASWQRDHPQADGLAEFAANVAQLRPTYQRVLDAVAAQRPYTIEAIMAMSDAELGLATLAGEFPTPHARER